MNSNVTLDNAQLLRAIDAAIARLANPRELLDEIGAAIEGNAQLRFKTKRDPLGVPWPALSPTTIEIYESDWFKARNPKFKARNPKFKNGIPGTLLERTRELRNSLAYNTGADWVEIGTNRATKGGKWQIGMLHEWGTVKMPRRGLLTADPETGTLAASDETEILAIVQRAMDEAFGGGG